VQRTNFYQTDASGAPKPYISFKIASPALADLPLPKPYREIFVWSPQVEGVHLRFGPVARGGLRWSDRRDDFRTETLNLAKAQHVKNSIIVPSGAKGGFFPKALPRGGKPADIRVAGVEAYKTFLRGLLDITDDIEDDHARRPENVVCWDEEDPYLVVAADKGTATFSDIANGVSAEYGFWLGDAFASGGSAGYDHKAMGITARGAWEAVKRHFREMGVNTQTTPFDVVGVGDMSGDVFGNGMLQSRKIRLLAAFDHRDIFIDPDPADLDAAWTERKRLFDLQGSSWQDYDRKLISAGGGVFSRQAKMIALSPEMKKLTGLIPDSVPVADLLSALLTAKCDLLWFGGIGAFIKAAPESHADAGDKANDSCRFDAEAVRAKVIGEGANLGVTQAGRIAYARSGGRINTDAVDNSAGVDTSDHEVNIKILLTDAERTGALPATERNPLLAAMTEEVAAHVLAHNYHQTLALSIAESCAGADSDANERLIVRLEAQGKLNRKVEGLPNTAAFADLREKGLGLTRPELSKLIAYSKIDLSDTLAASDAPDDPYFEQTLVEYFPTPLRRFEASMKRHRLRREIIATAVADAVVNIAGPTFIDRVCEAAQTKPHQAALAFAAAREIYRADHLAERVNALDNQIPARVQIALHQDIAASLRRATIALSRRLMAAPDLNVGALIDRYAASVEAQRVALWDGLSAIERSDAEADKRAHIAAGAPADLAQDIAALLPLTPAIDIADLARAGKVAPEAAALVYRALGAALSLDALRAGAGGLRLSQHFERLALRRLLTELHEDQRLLAQTALAGAGATPQRADRDWAEKAVRQWLTASETAARPALAAIEDMQSTGPWTFAKIVLAVAALRAFASAARAA
jgi:glutamate dehydrogenase